MTKPEADNTQYQSNSGSGPRTRPPESQGIRRVTITSMGKTDDDVRSRPPPAPDADVNEEVDPYVGSTIDGRYYVERQLGEGGMGVVYLCRHTIIDKKVAMKVLRADMARNEEVTERFLNEARSASSIGNAHIIDISDFGRLPDGATYFVMEFLSGTPMADLAEARVALDPERVGHIGIQLSQGLAAAHEAGIVHRDLKPDNIFLITQGAQEDFVKILDFGIAKASRNTSKLTQAGQVFGTPHYMSPEQAAGSEVDHRSDIYAVGIILYELSTGRLPFDADNFMAILTQHMYKEPMPPSSIEGLPVQLPEGLEPIILKCLAKSADDRYQSMTALGDDLREIFGSGLPVNSMDRRSLPDGALSRGSQPDRSSPDLGAAANIGATQVSAAAGAGAAMDTGPITPPTQSRMPLFIGLGVLVFAVIGGAAWAGSRSSAPEEAAPIVAEESTETEAEAKKEETPKEEAAAVEASPALVKVTLIAWPAEAHAFDGDKDLGKSPITIEVGESPLELEVRHKGYVSSALSVDGSKTTVQVSLKKESAAPAPRPRAQPRATAPRPAPAPAPKPKPRLGGGELVNPWD